MALTQAIAIGGLQLFKLRLLGRMQALARETGESSFALPVALFLLADEANGGEMTGPRLEQRFRLTDFEARNVVDAFFLGWSAAPPPAASQRPSMVFDPRALAGFRQALGAAGIKNLAGGADLVLVDCVYAQGVVRLSFSSALRIDLAAAKLDGRLPTVDGVLQSWVEALEAARSLQRPGGPAPWRWSAELGLAVARQSLLDGLVEGWDRARGAGWITRRAVRGLGPDLPLIQL